MKKYAVLFLAVLMLLALCACGDTPAAETTDPTPDSAPQTTALPSPTPYVEPETFSVMAGSVQADTEGTVWTSLAAMDGTSYLYDLLPEDVGYVYSFLITGDDIYAAVKEYNRSMDPASLWVFDKETGEGTLLADDLSPACSFCLVGDDIFLYRGSHGFWSLNASTGDKQQVLPEDADLIAARDGHFYYTLADGGLYRNNSTFTAQEKLLDDCPSYWLCPGTDAMFDLAYGEEGTKPILEYRTFDGVLQFSVNLLETPGGLWSDGDQVYVPQPGAGEILVYAMASGEQTGSILLPQEMTQCLVLHADSEALYCHTMADGLFQILRISTDGSGYEILADDILL